MEVGAVILAVAQLPDGFSSLSLEVDGGGVEENAIQTGKKIPATQEKVFFYHVLCATRGKGGGVPLILDLFSQKGHRPVKVMQRQCLDAIDHIIPVPPVTGPIRAGHEEPMQNPLHSRSLKQP